MNPLNPLNPHTEGVSKGKKQNDTGRRLAVRIAMEHPIGTLPPYTLSRFAGLHPQGSVSLDSRVASLPYESSSLATSRGNEKYGEEKQRVIYFMYYSAVSPFGGERSEPITRMLNMLYDAESQSRNADFILIARRAPPQPSGPKAPSNLRTLRPRAGQS